MRRRDFISFLASVSITRPIAARAQSAKQPTVGVLGSASPAAYTERLTAIRQGLAETGFAEGRTVAIDYRWAEGQLDRLPASRMSLSAVALTSLLRPVGSSQCMPLWPQRTPFQLCSAQTAIL
jgi:putative ABC transport system substrate-binding protein